MKMKSMMAYALAALVLTACNDNDNGPSGPDLSNLDVAYVSVSVSTEATTKAGSNEDNGLPAESALNSLYILTFNDNGDIIGIPETSMHYIKFEGTPVSDTPEAFKISASATKMLVVANPGTVLKNVITSTNQYSKFSTINEAITSTGTKDVDEIVGATGFTMINSGDESSLTAGQKITANLIDITDMMIIVDGTTITSEAQAKSEAELAANRVDVKIERLASKVQFKMGSTIETVPANGTFTFKDWTLDAVNKSFYPYAEKTLLSVAHGPSINPSYKYNFYTEDPNFKAADIGLPSNVGNGLRFTKVENDYSLTLATSWKGATAGDNFLYIIENTMEAAEQRYGNATRVVIKGNFYPDNTWTGDWFSFAGENYKDLADLQQAYITAGPASNLANACDAMLNKIKTFPGNTIAATVFEDLTQSELDQIVDTNGDPIGGEVVKDGDNPVIRWYQQGLCYYYYEIRHDDVTTVGMDFGKYGVVRNNWYSLTLNKVNGAGTPWYPDINNPGPGDPDPTDPIDEEAGFLGIDIEKAPWIIWERPIEI